jgi:hypothetical protein
MSMNPLHDNRRVALIKSLQTKNRFYALVTPESGIRNAGTVDTIPDHLMLGIAYPCLEDGLNDFAVIRTTFETVDLFPEDDPIRDEMMDIIHDARSNLIRRLRELRDKIEARLAHFLGTDYNEFKDHALSMVTRGYPRRNLDSMMKLNVFSSVAEAEGYANPSDILYYYEFGNGIDINACRDLPARDFIVLLFEDVLRAVMDDAFYKSKYTFDKFVFQKFIAVMFVNYATTDPMFYGISKQDYAVAEGKDMDETPLYLAVRKELMQIEQEMLAEQGLVPIVPTMPAYESLSEAAGLSLEQAASLLPGHLINEEVLMGPLTSLCSAAKLLLNKSDVETQRFAKLILHDASILMGEFKRLGIVSPLANDPGACGD